MELGPTAPFNGLSVVRSVPSPPNLRYRTFRMRLTITVASTNQMVAVAKTTR